MKLITRLILFLIFFKGFSQTQQVKVVEEKLRNRISFYALNESEKDYDVLITIRGNNIRQSTGKPRYIRVPATSKVLLKHIFTIRGKNPVYNYQLKVNDSLSRRALKRPFEIIEIPVKQKAITVYITDNCVLCNTIVADLKESEYVFELQNLDENESIRKQLEKSFTQSTVNLNSLKNPIIIIEGKIFLNIDSYDRVKEELEKE